VSAAVSAAAASARAAATARGGARPSKRAASSGYGAPAAPDEEWPDDEGSEPAGPDHNPAGGALSGLGLIQRTLGGEVIAELGHD
jgi:hypothetical protein